MNFHWDELDCFGASMDDRLDLVGTGVDLKDVDPIHQKRLLAFLNFWLSRTVAFLNRFASGCEGKLLQLDNRIQKMDTTLRLVELKLASIPGFDSISAASDAPLGSGQEQKKTPSVQPPAEKKELGVEKDNKAEASTEQSIRSDPAMETYFKMLAVGIPAAAVKHKMEMEGMDPSLLDNPNAPPPQKKQTEESESDFEASDGEDSESFSD